MTIHTILLLISMTLFPSAPSNPEIQKFESVSPFVGWSAHAKANEVAVISDGCQGNKGFEFTVFPDSYNAGGERAEARWDNEDGEGAVVDYSWCFKVPSNYIDSDPSNFQVMGQFHDACDTCGNSPPIAFYYGSTGFAQGVSLSVNGTVRHTVFFTKGTWNRIKLEIKWGTGSNGYVRFWWNGVPQIQVDGKNMVDSNFHYYKAGLYRNPAINTTNKVIYDDFRIDRH